MNEHWSDLTVADIMSDEVSTTEATTPIGDALEVMLARKISAMPVLEDGRCVGIVTATDLVHLIREVNKSLRSKFPHYDDCLWAVELAQRKLGDDPVREIMSVGVFSVSPNDSLARAAETMSRERVHHLAVEQDGNVVGFLSAIDLVNALLGRGQATSHP
jgi:CBS domain-containing protein